MAKEMKKEHAAKNHMHKHHAEMAKFHAKEHAHHMKQAAKHDDVAKDKALIKKMVKAKAVK